MCLNPDITTDLIAETLILLEDDLFYAGTLYLRLATKHLFPIGSKMSPCGHRIWPTSILSPHCISFENVTKCLQLFWGKVLVWIHFSLSVCKNSRFRHWLLRWKGVERLDLLLPICPWLAEFSHVQAKFAYYHRTTK